ncbi:DUF3365 domain-containing protein [Salinimicrobium catena]|uniref:Tll0287-like domain-containing protein n=1 Tax=Salinimicrobium catena TaxID=390640 RepID=UPI002FE4B159
MQNSVVYLLLLVFLGSCLRDKRLSAVYIPLQDKAARNLQEHRGKKLMETQCYVCHSPTAAMDEMIAPPMAAIKAHYLLDQPSKGEFIKAIVSFVEDPSAGKAKMPGAVARFGTMPLQNFPENSVEQIAEYLYDHQVEEPEWFSEHWKAGPGKGIYRQQGRRSNAQGQSSRTQYEEKGIKIAMEAQQLLGQNLMREIQKNGTLEALEFCNLQAIPLTDSVANKFDASVQRVSDRNRNPVNSANSEEKAIIEVFKREMSAGKDPQPVLKMKRDSVGFYYPLVTITLCLQCHGKQEEMEFEVKEKILKLYPQDKATGYSENEVRGIWKIAFKK